MQKMEICTRYNASRDLLASCLVDIHRYIGAYESCWEEALRVLDGTVETEENTKKLAHIKQLRQDGVAAFETVSTDWRYLKAAMVKINKSQPQPFITENEQTYAWMEMVLPLFADAVRMAGSLLVELPDMVSEMEESLLVIKSSNNR